MSTEMPLVSVIVPVYNGEAFLEAAISNLRGQDYANIEIILVDDGSTDATAVVAAKSGRDITYIYQSNQGPAAARNAGIRAASGEFIGLLDVDDLWPGGSLTLRMRYLLEYPSLEVVIGRTQLMKVCSGENGKPVFEKVFAPFACVVVGSALYRRSAFDRIGLFDQALRFGEDMDWYMRAKGHAVPMAEITETCLYYRRHEKGMTCGKNTLELNMAKVLKMSLDRRREMGADRQQLPAIPHIREYAERIEAGEQGGA